MKTYNVILSGGVGSRLWPLSRKHHPKQFLKMFEGKSLFELTAERNKDIVDEIIVVGNTDHVEWSKQLLKDISIPTSFVIETVARNTTAAITYAALSVSYDDILIITPSDHLIENQETYQEAIEKAKELALQNFLVTFGVVPTKPEIGYGYIEYHGCNVVSFREKPSNEVAQQFLREGTFLWNSGMFCFKASVFLEELNKYQPQLLQKCKEAWSQSQGNCISLEASLQIPSISIDYALMEYSNKIKVVPARFKWNDLGSFESLYDYLHSLDHPIDENGNMVIGTDIFTAFVGVENSILVHTPDAMLILQKDSAQDVKIVYNNLEKNSSNLI